MSEKTVEELEAVIANAIATILSLGSFDGGHHKQYALDQALRVLTECPVEEVQAKDYNGQEYIYERLAANERYEEVALSLLLETEGITREEYEEDPDEYALGVWDEGIAP